MTYVIGPLQTEDPGPIEVAMSTGGPNGQHRFRVLVVDDEPMATSLLSRALGLTGAMEVEPFTSPIEALRRLETQHFDAIVSDQLMPEMTGVELLSRAVKIQPHAVRIILTAYPELEMALRAINDAQVHRLLTKPYDVKQLRACILDLLEQRKKERQAAA